MDTDTHIFITGENTFYYRLEKNSAVIEKADIMENYVEVPSVININGENIPVTGIGKKVFMGNNSLLGVTLPDSVIAMDNWVFAQCQNLRKIVIPNAGVTFGKGVFLDCPALEYVYVGNTENEAKAAAFAAVCNITEWEYIYNCEDTEKWFERWDNTLETYIGKDDEGTANDILGGEEDISKSRDTVVMEKQQKKAELCFLRLHYRENISEAVKNTLLGYLKAHSENSNRAAWQFILKTKPDCLWCYDIMYEAGGINDENRDDIMNTLGKYHIEAKNHIINLISKEDKKDIFAEFIL